MTRKESKKGDHNVFQAGSMMIKFYQNNYHHIKGSWTGEDDGDYTEYEEIKDEWVLKKSHKEEPNYFQTGRFLKRIRSLGSRPAVGSSTTRIRGRLSSMRAIPIRCFMPPEN